ncbi:hypothetical protein [Burkholderia vietnamiensis]|uniref:hypothetical protein n=1 Tax=Burkholderia vietnamiensis TaxID=60552 RepID=UPI001CF210AC|nr:hypothetical protein [Burkholderia vietnamiensis]MCA8228324.1 hypothetical protein [Burkholderia vietnamiensis]
MSKKISVGLIPVVGLAFTAFGFGFAVEAALSVGPKMAVPLLLSIFAFGAVVVAVVMSARESNG